MSTQTPLQLAEHFFSLLSSNQPESAFKDLLSPSFHIFSPSTPTSTTSFSSFLTARSNFLSHLSNHTPSIDCILSDEDSGHVAIRYICQATFSGTPYQSTVTKQQQQQQQQQKISEVGKRKRKRRNMLKSLKRVEESEKNTVEANGKEAVWTAAIVLKVENGKIMWMAKEWDRAMVWSQFGWPLDGLIADLDKNKLANRNVNELMCEKLSKRGIRKRQQKQQQQEETGMRVEKLEKTEPTAHSVFMPVQRGQFPGWTGTGMEKTEQQPKQKKTDDLKKEEKTETKEPKQEIGKAMSIDLQRDDEVKTDRARKVMIPAEVPRQSREVRVSQTKTGGMIGARLPETGEPGQHINKEPPRDISKGSQNLQQCKVQTGGELGERMPGTGEPGLHTTKEQQQPTRLEQEHDVEVQTGGELTGMLRPSGMEKDKNVGELGNYGLEDKGQNLPHHSEESQSKPIQPTGLHREDKGKWKKEKTGRVKRDEKKKSEERKSEERSGEEAGLPKIEYGAINLQSGCLEALMKRDKEMMKNIEVHPATGTLSKEETSTTTQTESTEPLINAGQ